jgi:biopolymer transport protein ExbD
MAAKKKKSHLDDASEEAKMDMTPMIDVVFLLIIFFLCIDFKILEAKLPAYLPKDVGSFKDPVEPQEKVRIKIVCDNWGTPVDRPYQSPDKKKKAFYLVHHDVHYTVGPKRVENLDELKDELNRIKPDKWITDPKTGQRELVGVVVEPGTGAVYADVAPCVDVILTAGFKNVNFGGGLGSRRTGAYAKQPKPAGMKKGGKKKKKKQ